VRLLAHPGLQNLRRQLLHLELAEGWLEVTLDVRFTGGDVARLVVNEDLLLPLLRKGAEGSGAQRLVVGPIQFLQEFSLSLFCQCLVLLELVFIQILGQSLDVLFPVGTDHVFSVPEPPRIAAILKFCAFLVALPHRRFPPLL
jgi:hypothetical protein